MGLKARNLETGERGSAGDGAQRASGAGRESTHLPAEGSGEVASREEFSHLFLMESEETCSLGQVPHTVALSTPSPLIGVWAEERETRGTAPAGNTGSQGWGKPWR